MKSRNKAGQGNPNMGWVQDLKAPGVARADRGRVHFTYYAAGCRLETAVNTGQLGALARLLCA